ncbi:hypothetical protein CJU89_1164 [Yarrowia sp. B02]|nr:hypothetical protein CJU89_1164 [Yarrowia sp. B02]
MLNTDIFFHILETGDLETGVALSDTCKTLHQFYKKLDGTLVRDKVLKRVPWFEPDACDAKSWIQCAKLLVSRSKRAMGSSDDNLFLLKDLTVAASLGTNKATAVELAEFEDTANDLVRAQMRPLFRGEISGTGRYEDVVSGIEWYFPGGCVNLSTMFLTPDFEYRYKEAYDYSTWPNQSSEYGSLTEVRNEDTDGFVRIMVENNVLLHVRFLSSKGLADTLIYKDPDHEGPYILTSETKPLFLHPRDTENLRMLDPRRIQAGIVSLQPGDGGALVIKNCTDQPERQLIAYVEPVPELSTVLVCTLPASRHYVEWCTDHDTRFFASYDGYLFVHLEGRFVRLWVDFGYRSALHTETSKIDKALSSDVESRCLTVWDRSYPLTGHLEIVHCPGRGLEISRGGERGRYLTTHAAMGQGYVDLKTGETFFSDHQYHEGICFPFLTQTGEIKFGSISDHVARTLLTFAQLHIGDLAGGPADLTPPFAVLSERAQSAESTKLKCDDEQDSSRDDRYRVRNRELEEEPRDDTEDYERPLELKIDIYTATPEVAMNSTIMNVARDLVLEG